LYVTISEVPVLAAIHATASFAVRLSLVKGTREGRTVTMASGGRASGHGRWRHDRPWPCNMSFVRDTCFLDYSATPTNQVLSADHHLAIGSYEYSIPQKKKALMLSFCLTCAVFTFVLFVHLVCFQQERQKKAELLHASCFSYFNSMQVHGLTRCLVDTATVS
jgi:ribosomal protein S26